MSQQQPPSGPPSGPPYPPAPGGYPGYGYGYTPPPPDHPQTSTIMILGILGIVLCQACAPFAWYMASKARKEIAAAPPGAYGPSTGITVGYALGIAGTILMIVVFLFLIVYFVVIVAIFGAAISSGST